MTNLKNFARSRLLPIAERFGVDRSRLQIPWGSSLFHDLTRARLISKRPLIFDVGANVGQTVANIRRHYPLADIHAFEPCSSTFEQLNRSTQRDPRTKAHRLALSDEDGEATLKTFEASVLNQLTTADEDDTIQESTGRESVPTARLDTFLGQHAIDAVDLLKIDTEGSDLAVLRGASSALAAGRIGLVYCEVGFGTVSRFVSYEEVASYLSGFGLHTLGIYGQLPSMWLRKSDRRLDFANALFAREP